MVEKAKNDAAAKNDKAGSVDSKNAWNPLKVMVQTLVIDLILFTVLYFLNFCVLKPTKLYDKDVMNQKLDGEIELNI